MSNKAWAVQAVVLCAAVAVGLTFSVPGSPAQEKAKEPVRVKWEYKVVSTHEEKTLNELGEQGWELIKVSGGYPYTSRSAVSPQLNTTEYTPRLHYFRRQK